MLCFQVLRGGLPGGAGSGLLHLGLMAEPLGSGHHDHLLPHHRLHQTALHQEVHLDHHLHLHHYHHVDTV